MRNILVCSFVAILFFLQCIQNETALCAQNNSTVKGVVYHDKTGEKSYDPKRDKPLKGIAVSNGCEVVTTNQNGEYELPIRNNSAIFVIKPRNWKVPVDENQIPEFYYIHSPNGASGDKFEGLSKTGPLPESINFPLYPSDEPDSFDVLVFADTQPRSEQEMYYFTQSVIPELINTNKAAFGITLGDVVGNDLSLFNPMIEAVSTIDIPWRYVLGNHDLDHSAENNTDARGVWLRTFGPSYYSFTYGAAHFIVLDNIQWLPDQKKVNRRRQSYGMGLGKVQMEFLKNEIKRLKSDQLLVLLAHIPFGGNEWEDEVEKKAFYELIASHPKSFSLVGHKHNHFHNFVDVSESKTHHMISVGAVSGSIWGGALDEYGIPNAMMSDGTPKSYSFLHINGNEWKLSWKAIGKSEDFQMHIHIPESVTANNRVGFKVTANIFNALPSADVKIKIGMEGKWFDMIRVFKQDPILLDITERKSINTPWPKNDYFAISKHLWEFDCKINLQPGIYPIEIKAEDNWNEYNGKRLLYVKK